MSVTLEARSVFMLTLESEESQPPLSPERTLFSHLTTQQKLPVHSRYRSSVFKHRALSSLLRPRFSSLAGSFSSPKRKPALDTKLPGLGAKVSALERSVLEQRRVDVQRRRPEVPMVRLKRGLRRL